MKAKLQIVISILLLGIGNVYFAQNIDSLKNLLSSTNEDTIKCNILNSLIQSEVDDKIWMVYNNQLVAICENHIIRNDEKLKPFYYKHYASTYFNLGLLELQLGNYNKSLEYFQRSYDIQKKVNGKYEMANSANFLGSVYEKLGNIPKAIDCYYESLRIREEINDREGISYSLKSISSIYSNQGDYEKAIVYLKKGLNLQIELKDKLNIANSLNKIGFMYFKLNDYNQALIHYQKSIDTYKEIDNKQGEAYSLNSIGSLYSAIKEYSKAKEYFNRSLDISRISNNLNAESNTLTYLGQVFEKENSIKDALKYYFESLKIREESKNKIGINYSLGLIANGFLKNGNINQAVKYGEKALTISRELGFPENIKESSIFLKELYLKKGDYKKAYEMQNLYKQMDDSLNNDINRKAYIQKEFQYEYSKKTIADSLKITEERKINQLKFEKEKTQRLFLYNGLALVLIFAGLIFNRYKIIKKQSLTIGQQKVLVEEKHKEITDSINYAERIQRSFLATSTLLDDNLLDYFVLFQPKDVVSGDFYWAHKLSNGKFALVTADSTGHGVPGAIMSLLNVTSLESAIKDGHNEPGEIFNHTRNTIIERLKKDGSTEGGKDGMDASLICFDFKNNNFIYTTANNPIWVVRQNELIELKGDKMPVGKHDKDQVPFTQHDFELMTGDIVYTLTDGFPDQFGGAKGKKFMYKQLKELLVSISTKPLVDQKEALHSILKEWMGDVEQVDDITIIGVRI